MLPKVLLISYVTRFCYQAIRVELIYCTSSGVVANIYAEKVLRFGHAMETANLPYKLQLSVFWKLSKPLLFVISLQN